MHRRSSALVAGALLALPVTVAAGPPESGPAAASPKTSSARDFRVLPYLQAPNAHGMRLTWFSERPGSGKLIVSGPGIDGKQTHPVAGRLQDELAYTDLEREQEIPGLEPGSWLLGEQNYKHTIELDRLRPESRYRYMVEQGSSSFRGEFRTAPSRHQWRHIRLIAMSDSETEPLGRVQRREWAPGALADGSEARPSTDPGSPWDQAFGTAVLSGTPVLRYPLTEDEGLRRNLAVVGQRSPDAVLFTGDLVQGGGYQPGWDEFFRHTAGETGDLLTSTPVLPAFGNWESFGAINGGYGTPDDRTAVVRSRAKYHAYFDAPHNGLAAHRDNYYRVDYGPVTVLTLDSNNGQPDDAPENYPDDEKLTGRQYTGPGPDTQNNFTAEEYANAGGTDLSAYNPGSRQWAWAKRQLSDARADGQVVIVQFHHVPFSSGEHGLPMNHELTSGQGGTPMRVYHPLFERYGVAAVISGHSEMFERSFVDRDGDGVGVHYYDVGVSGDGLRGVRRNGPTLDSPLLNYNRASQWTADRLEPERWVNVDGQPILVSGGKHYGHLEINLTRARSGHGATMQLTPVHVFPVLDSDLNLVRTERREYSDRVVLEIDARGAVVG